MQFSESARQWYESYSKNMESGLVGLLMGISHKMMEKRFTESYSFGRVLELGATNPNHLTYVRHQFERYDITDIESYSSLEKLHDRSESGQKKKISFSLADAENLKNFDTDSIDRLIATCLILHLSNPRKVLSEWRRVVNKDGGVLTFYVHCEPGAFLRFVRFIHTILMNRKSNYDHLSFVYREHLIHYLAIKYAVKEVFCDDKVKVTSFPFPLLSWNFNFWKIYQITLSKR